jgi:meso-butanediol dehydrogenase/(S,S)-butanediol dehydrogenase/diacetyl reductase
MSAKKLQGRVALVTGGGRGIGRAIALAYAREGAKLAIAARTHDELAAVAGEIQQAGSEAVCIDADLGESSSPARVVRQTLEAFGTLDILVNNAGVVSASDPRPVVDFRDEFWNMTLAVNLTAPYLLCKAFLPTFLAKKSGRIINVASLAGKMGLIHGSAYAASKHGLLGLTRCLALEVADQGITVNAICPGPVRSVANDKRVRYDAGRLGTTFEDLERRITPIGRRLDPEEMAPLAVLLASDESAAITGQAFNVCGGALMV